MGVTENMHLMNGCSLSAKQLVLTFGAVVLLKSADHHLFSSGFWFGSDENTLKW